MLKQFESWIRIRRYKPSLSVIVIVRVEGLLQGINISGGGRVVSPTEQ
jgi:hypothetical protein